MLERRQDLAPEARRLLVDDEEVGSEALRGLEDQRFAQAHSIVERKVEVEARVVAVRQLGDARYADVVDAASELEVADDGRARQDHHGGVGPLGDERVGDRPRAAQMPESEGVVAVDEDPCACAEALAHARGGPRTGMDVTVRYAGRLRVRARRGMTETYTTCRTGRRQARHDH